MGKMEVEKEEEKETERENIVNKPLIPVIDGV